MYKNFGREKMLISIFFFFTYDKVGDNYDEWKYVETEIYEK